jgi:8-oxo-dGTP pyrophosphatase MutT (NUDIX family)
MTDGLLKAWTEMVQPLFRRPPECQVAALCVRQEDGEPKVLLITSRDTGRWVLPKGWLMEDKTAAEAARTEAWEEAGVKKCSGTGEAIGTYSYEKRLDDGYVSPVEVQVFQLDVTDIVESFPEARERDRLWVTPQNAAEMVDEPGLQALFQQM